MSRRRGRGELLALVKQLAARPEGVSTRDLIDRMARVTNCPILPNAARAGHIFKAQREGMQVRWFLTQQAADAWLALGPIPKAPKKPRGRPRKTTETVAKPAAVKPRKLPKPKPHQQATFSPPTIDDTKMRPAGQPIITADTIITLDTAERPTAKWQMLRLQPDPRYPAWSSAPLGVDPLTGRAWGAGV